MIVTPTFEQIWRVAMGKPFIPLYARSNGWHMHTDKECQMLKGDQFKRLGYKEITISEARYRNLNPCFCMVRMLGGKE